MIVLYIIGGIIALLLLVSLVAPKSYEVHRSIVIDRSLEEVYDYLRMIKNQSEWSPWKKKDPDMKQEYLGTDGEVGFIAKWEGNKDVGVGEQEITRLEPNNSIETELRFFKPWKSVSNGYLTVEQVGQNQTKVVWGFKGVNPIPFNLLMLFMNFDKAVGKDFDEGLGSLKNVLEN